MGSLCSNWTPTFCQGGELPLDSKVISMLVVFLWHKILILIFFSVLWKILCRNEIMVFLGFAHFPDRVNMKSFQKVFSKLENNCSSNGGQVVQLNDFLPGFLLSMSFCRRMGNTVIFIVLCKIWVFLRV